MVAGYRGAEAELDITRIHNSKSQSFLMFYAFYKSAYEHVKTYTGEEEEQKQNQVGRN